MKRRVLATFLGLTLITTFVGCGSNEKKVNGDSIAIENESSDSENKGKDSSDKLDKNQGEKKSQEEEKRPEISKELEENSVKTKDKMIKMFESNNIKYKTEESKGLERIIAQDQFLKDGDLTHAVAININYNSGMFEFTNFIGYDEAATKDKKPVVDLNAGLTGKFIEGIVGEKVDLSEYSNKINDNINANYPKLVHEELEDFELEVKGYRIKIVPNRGMYKNGVILTVASDISK